MRKGENEAECEVREHESNAMRQCGCKDEGIKRTAKFLRLNHIQCGIFIVGVGSSA